MFFFVLPDKQKKKQRQITKLYAAEWTDQRACIFEADESEIKKKNGFVVNHTTHWRTHINILHTARYYYNTLNVYTLLIHLNDQ